MAGTLQYFSPSDEAVSAALSLPCPGVTQSNQNVRRLITPNRGLQLQANRSAKEILIGFVQAYPNRLVNGRFQKIYFASLSRGNQ